MTNWWWIASRGPGYGIPSYRVDGNDLLAVYNVTKATREQIMAKPGPVLIEAITYRYLTDLNPSNCLDRVGHHSTSDDSTAYRDKQEIEEWSSRNNPITRFYKYLVSKGLWSEEEDKEWREQVRDHVLTELVKAEKEKKPPIEEMFTDVYAEIPPNLREQREELRQLLKEFPNELSVDEYEDSPSFIK